MFEAPETEHIERDSDGAASVASRSVEQVCMGNESSAVN